MCFLLGDRNGCSSAASGSSRLVGYHGEVVDDLGFDNDFRAGLLGDVRPYSRTSRHGSGVCRLLMVNDKQGEKE